MNRKKITEDDRQAAIGRAYASGIRDGHNGTAYNNGSWLTAQARQEAVRAVEEVVEDHTAMRDRIEAEYERHTPVLKPDRVRLGDSISEPRLLFSCAADGCREGWPCQTWHLLRHLASFDKTTYAITVNRQAREDGAP